MEAIAKQCKTQDGVLSKQEFKKYDTAKVETMLPRGHLTSKYMPDVLK